jgi:excisionase family DNA binding protein
MKQLDPKAQNRLLSTAEVAALLGCSPRHIRRLLAAGKFPEPRLVGELSRWPEIQIRGWIDSGCPPCPPRTSHDAASREVNP